MQRKKSGNVTKKGGYNITSPFKKSNSTTKRSTKSYGKGLTKTSKGYGKSKNIEDRRPRTRATGGSW